MSLQLFQDYDGCGSVRFSCAFCNTKHKPNYIQRHVNNCKLAKIENLRDHFKMFQNSEPEPPADFPDFYEREDDTEEGI